MEDAARTVAAGTATADAAVADGESRALTGLRGLAALLVVLHHCRLHLGLDTGVPALQALLMRGYLGVDLFFVLSGFVMAMTYGTWFDGVRGFALDRYLRFMVRRIARLWPLHAAVLVVFVLAALPDPAFPFSSNRLLANVAMVQAWGLSSAVNPPAWSVSTELFAYAVFPFLVILALRGRVRVLLCLAGIGAALATCVYGGPPLGLGRRGLLDVYFNDSFLPVLRCLAGFTAGMLAWRAGRSGAVRRVATWWGTGPAALVVAAGLVVAGAPDLLVFAVLPAAVLGLHHGRGPAWRLLGFGPVHRLGVLSYAVYLCHLFVLDHLRPAAVSMGVDLLLFAAATLAVAVVAHAAVEVPGRRVLRALGESALAQVAVPRPNRPLHDPPR